MSRVKFKIEAETPGSKARAGSMMTLHGPVQTPVFMPVGTLATVRTQSFDLLRSAGSRVLLANTYHLMRRPGVEVFRKFGGIHRFMSWDGPVLTDSGGFQIFSLKDALTLDEQGATFRSEEGNLVALSPEQSIEMQKAIGSDIMMVLDQCVPSTSEYALAFSAMELTHRWALRSLKARGDSPQALFGIVQGACFPDLRKRSAEFLTGVPFDGLAIGGLAVGESKAEREDVTEATTALLPRDLPRYLMGVGTPIDILEAVHRGVDMFDCIIPSQWSQRGVAFTSHGKLQLRRSTYRFSEDLLDQDCDCPTCRTHSRGYLHHLIKAEEILGWQLLTTHNLYFYHRLVREIRQSIVEHRFAELYRARRGILDRADEDHPVTAPRRGRPPRSERWQKAGDYELHTSPEGFTRVRQISSGEIMHSVSDPAAEAELLYVRQARLADRLGSADPKPLVIWDVGLGAASNAMAAVRCFQDRLEKNSPGTTRPLRLISFERDLDPLLLASKHANRFPHLRHPAPYVILEGGEWKHESGLLSWELRKGDFLERMEGCEPPELIFYDPFSFKTDSVLWTPEVFSRIHRCCSGVPADLYTYSASTAVRAALLSAGFYVSQGVETGPKSETTVAHSRLSEGAAYPRLLGAEWLQRWRRSGARIPTSVPEERHAEFEARILGHAQFSSLT